MCENNNLLYFCCATIFVDTILFTVKVLAYDKYEEKMGSEEEKIYFMRTAYNTFQEKIISHPSEWGENLHLQHA